ncbi:uncharacterized protein LOC119097317 [Pollicipes pollicipes]|uniref:uncharacterized protein LOC119097317 n=1 Tax=Pollicipes pollicipes TaxID=41117 RepID=UPI001885A0FB|nr:uncharacterized protein LOC119097317 [Pollicipes pollicipes]
MPWWFGRYRAELRPRPDATKPLRRLLNKRRQGRPLGRLQTRLLDRFLAARDCLILECKLCSYVTRLPLRARRERAPVDSPKLEHAQRRLQKMLLQSDKRTSDTGLMAFLSQV